MAHLSLFFHVLEKCPPNTPVFTSPSGAPGTVTLRLSHILWSPLWGAPAPFTDLGAQARGEWTPQGSEREVTFPGFPFVLSTYRGGWEAEGTGWGLTGWDPPPHSFPLCALGPHSAAGESRDMVPGQEPACGG